MGQKALQQEAAEWYSKALKLGQKEARECQQKNRPVNPEVLHQVVGDLAADRSICIGLVEIPALIIEADDRKVMELGLIENLQREDEGEVVCLQGQHEVLVALSEEMAEGPLDCAAGSLAWIDLLFN